MPAVDKLYRETILEHYRAQRNQGSLPCPPAITARGFNPLCGDDVKVFLIADNDIITDIKIAGNGCSISQASASMMTCALKGKSFAEANLMTAALEQALQGGSELPDGDSELDSEAWHALQSVADFPIRIKCVMLSWEVAVDLLTEF